MKRSMSPEKLRLPSRPRILVVTPNWLGDAVMSLPTLEALRDLYPGCRLSVLTRQSLADLFAGCELVDEVLPSSGKDAGKLSPWGRQIREIRRHDFHLALVLPRSFRSALAPFLARIPVRLGYSTEGRRWLLTHLVPRRREFLRVHRVRYYMHLLERLGHKAEPAVPRLVVPAEHRQRARALLAREFGEMPRSLVALHPGAAYGTAKRWYPERYAELALRLIREDVQSVVLLGGPGEQELSEEIRRHIADGLEHSRSMPGPRGAACRSRLANLAGRTSILELAALMEHCRVLVCNDTGTMHVAAAVGTPIVAIFGPTDPRTTSPYAKKFRIVRHPVPCSPCLLRTCPIDHPCMKEIPVERVLQETRAWLLPYAKKAGAI